MTTSPGEDVAASTSTMAQRLALLDLLSNHPVPGPSGRWLNGPLLGFDTETTGVDTDNDRIVTVALIASTGPGTACETVCTWLIDPGVEIPDGAAQVHGVTTEHARANGMAPAAALEEVAQLLAGSMGRGIPVVAYNASFDLRIIEAELSRNGLPTLTQRQGRQVGPIIDPLVLDRGLDRWRKGKRTLTDLVKVLGIAQDGRMHTADVDVSSTLAVLRALAAKHQTIGASDVDSLQSLQASLHRRWADGFNAYLARNGKPATASPDWPGVAGPPAR